MFGWFWEIVASATTSMTFLGIFLVGITFSLFSLIMGGHGEGDHDFSHDHDFGHDHAGDHDDAHHDGDHGESWTSFFNVGLLSVRGAALFATAFGGVGFLVQNATGKIYFSTAAGLVCGYLFSFLVLYVMKTLKAQQSNSLIDMNQAVGMEAIVVTSIPANGAGEIRFVLSGQMMNKMAYANDGGTIRSGNSVRINRINGGAMFVSPLGN